MEIQVAQESELEEIESFYSEVGYTGGARTNDEILVARSARAIMGVVRLCSEEGHLVLRGMYVSSANQGKGIGSALLAAISEKIGRRECWCIPFDHLGRFYGHAGFEDSVEAPDFLAARMARYQSEGASVKLMVRAQDWLDR